MDALIFSYFNKNEKFILNLKNGNSCPILRFSFLYGWKYDACDELIYEVEANTTLYTMMTAIPAQAKKTVYESGVCRKLWRGEKGGIFCISKKKCVGDEIGWQFLKEIHSRGFCTGKTSVSFPVRHL